MPTPPFLDAARPIVLAHRGGGGERPENSAAAFDNAVRLGYRYVETDARVTSDGVLLAFHDAVLDPTTDRAGRIADLPWSEVSRARIAGTEPVVRLEDLLGSWPGLRVNVDLKEPRAVRAFAEVVRRTGSVDRVCAASFSSTRLTAARLLLGPRLCSSIGPVGTAALRASSYGPPALARLRLPRRFAADCAQLPERHGSLPLADARLIARAHRRGWPVQIWTVDRADDVERLLGLGADGFVTDQPTAIRDALVALGRWPG